MRNLSLLGLNHSTAPLQLREMLALDGPRRAAALQSLRQRVPGCEAVMLCTCNRVELYVAGPQESSERISKKTSADSSPQSAPQPGELAQFLAELRGLSANQLLAHAYHRQGTDVVSHLFSVASSLDSMVVGETQILGQVRQAYEEARQAGMTGPRLHPLFQRALSVGRLVMSQTSLAEGRLSVASIAVDFARRIFDVFDDKTVLSIGAGKMAGLVLGNLASLAPRQLLICNRDPKKALALAGRFGGQPVAFENLANHLWSADIVVTSTGSEHPIITRAQFEGVMRLRRYKPVFIIDIAMPRDVAADVAELENVYLYNLDDLQQVAAATLDHRTGAIDAARQIVADQVRHFAARDRLRELGPLIHRLYRASHARAQQELAQTLSHMSGIDESERRRLEEVARQTVNKLLHDPVQMLRDAQVQHAPLSQYLHAMEKLFKLEDEKPEDEKPEDEKLGDEKLGDEQLEQEPPPARNAEDSPDA